LKMKLVKYRVNKFRTVKGTEWVETESISCLVGENESGKTNLLLPLWKLNPSDDFTKIDVFEDYPRGEYHLIEKDDELKKDAFAEGLFELTAEDKMKICQIFSENSNTENDDVNAEAKTDSMTFPEVSNFLLVKRDYNNNLHLFFSDLDCREVSKELEEATSALVFDSIAKLIPKFVYYSEYGNLDARIHLPKVIQDIKNISTLKGRDQIRARTLLILFSFLGLSADKVLELGNQSNQNDPYSKTEEVKEKESRGTQERFALLNSASGQLTNRFNSWWKQGEYKFRFNADGEYFRIYVSDLARKDELELEARSKGLQWFLSFFLVFLEVSKTEHSNCILLLDEPGLSLHPNAQADLIKFFAGLSEKNQLIYTTHMPFLVDHNNLSQVKAVFVESGLTKVTNDLSRSGKLQKSLQPVNAAIGISVSQTLLAGCKVIIVEGISDQIYLNFIKNYLVANEKYVPKSEIVFLPVGGASGVKPIVSILKGSLEELPNVLLDSDRAGKDYKTSLISGIYAANSEKIFEIESYAGKDSAEVEDLMRLGDFLEAFEWLHRPDEPIIAANFNPNSSIVPQIIEFARKNSIELEKGWKTKVAMRCVSRASGNDEKVIVDKWEKLFNDIG